MNNPSATPQGPAKNQDLVFGTRAVIEAIHAGRDIDKLFVQQGLSNELVAQLLQVARQNHIPVSRVPLQRLNKFTRKNHQGVVCLLSAVSFRSLDNVISTCFAAGQDPLLVVLDRITDVRNLGAIVRTAECAGAHAVVVPAKGSASISSDAMKTSAGALNHLPLCREDSLYKTVRYLQQSGIRVVACTEKAAESLYATALEGPLALVFGSEEDGISNELLKIADHLAALPMQGKVGSLNVSAAAAVTLFEAVRQRG